MKICVMGNARSAHTQRWAAAYAERGHDVHVLSIRTAEIPGVTVHPVHVGTANSGFAPAVLLSYLRLLFSIRRRLRRLTPEVVHAHYSVTHGVIAAASGFHPVVLSVWGTDVVALGGLAGPTYRLLNRYALRRADRVTSTSAFMMPLVENLAGRPLTIEQVPFGVELDVFTPADRPADDRPADDPFTVGYVKHLKPRYGPTNLIEAAGLLVEEIPGLRVVLAGDGELLPDLRRQVTGLGLEGHVEFLGRVPHDQVPDLMNSFDVFVNPSVVPESFGVAILEASAAGLPVVATAVGGVPEVTIDETTALMIEPGRPDQLASALRRLHADPGLRARLGAAGRSFVAERYQWHDNVSQMERVLATVARTSQ
ncbi:MAG: glycosyltransferase [Acidimicrobiia bacterium]|nr:glycosyltransferase [Acidimicrobiia bacterium]